MARADSLTLAVFWALRSQKLRRAGKHSLEDIEIARAFAGEWGLERAERGKLLRVLLAATLKAA